MPRFDRGVVSSILTAGAAKVDAFLISDNLDDDGRPPQTRGGRPPFPGSPKVVRAAVNREALVRFQPGEQRAWPCTARASSESEALVLSFARRRPTTCAFHADLAWGRRRFVIGVDEFDSRDQLRRSASSADLVIAPR